MAILPETLHENLLDFRIVSAGGSALQKIARIVEQLQLIKIARKKLDECRIRRRAVSGAAEPFQRVVLVVCIKIRKPQQHLEARIVRMRFLQGSIFGDDIVRRCFQLAKQLNRLNLPADIQRRHFVQFLRCRQRIGIFSAARKRG